jgi:6-phospho-beta-glucosidase
LIQTIKSFEQMAIEAAVEGSREKAIVALTINPLVANDKVAIAIVDEMLEAHRAYLPSFFEK